MRDTLHAAFKGCALKGIPSTDALSVKFSPGFYRRQFHTTATTRASERALGPLATGALADAQPSQRHGPISSQEEFRIMRLGTSCQSGDR